MNAILPEPETDDGFEPQARGSLGIEWLFTLISLALGVVIVSHVLAYREGAGSYPGGRSHEIWLFFLAGFLSLCVVGGLAVRLNGSWRRLDRRARRWMLILLGINIALPVASILIGIPGHQAYLRGFATRVARVVTVDEGIRQWLRERYNAEPDYVSYLNDCPEAIRKMMAGLLTEDIPENSWRVGLASDSIAEFTTVCGMHRPWGFGVCFAGEAPASSDRYHCLIPINRHLFVFDLES